MKVKVTWRADNPFIAAEKRDMVRTADLPEKKLDNTDQIEEWAREATPEGFHLHTIDYDLWQLEFSW